MDLKYCFSTQIRSVATSLIKNTYSGSLNDLRASPKQPQECQILVAVIVHTVSVFITKQSAMFHQPFTKMLAGSSALLVSDRSVICLWPTLLVYIYMFFRHRPTKASPKCACHQITVYDNL